MLEWHENTKGLKAEDRLAAALKKWDDLLEQQGFRFRGYYYGGGWDWRKLEPLIRGGKPIIPLIEAHIDTIDELGIIGNYEAVLATIRGKPNEAVIRKLLSSENPSYRHHYAFQACEIIVASGSVDWMDELNMLQYRKYFTAIP